jgi:hypothetical protein
MHAQCTNSHADKCLGLVFLLSTFAVGNAPVKAAVPGLSHVPVVILLLRLSYCSPEILLLSTLNLQVC